MVLHGRRGAPRSDGPRSEETQRSETGTGWKALNWQRNLNMSSTPIPFSSIGSLEILRLFASSTSLIDRRKKPSQTHWQLGSELPQQRGQRAQHRRKVRHEEKTRSSSRTEIIACCPRTSPEFEVSTCVYVQNNTHKNLIFVSFSVSSHGR